MGEQLGLNLTGVNKIIPPLNTNPDIPKPLIRCSELQAGMIFEPCNADYPDSWRDKWDDPDAYKTWKIISKKEGSRSLFACCPIDNKNKEVLLCFDAVMEQRKHNFRFSDEAP